MNTIDDLKNDYREVFEFKLDSEIFKRDKKGLDLLNKILDADFKVLFRKVEQLKSATYGQSFNWDSEKIFVVTKNGKVVEMCNSEWSTFKIV